MWPVWSIAIAAQVDTTPTDLRAICSVPTTCAPCAAAVLDSPLWARSVQSALTPVLTAPVATDLLAALPHTTPRVWRARVAEVALGHGISSCPIAEPVPASEPWAPATEAQPPEGPTSHTPDLHAATLRAVMGAKNGLRACTTPHSQRFQGRLTVGVTVHPSGHRTTVVKPIQGTPPDALTACIIAAIEAARFPVPTHDTLEWAIPLTFE